MTEWRKADDGVYELVSGGLVIGFSRSVPNWIGGLIE